MKTHIYFFVTVLFNIFMRQTLTDDFGGLHKNMNCAFPSSHNILIYNRATFNNRVLCCVDLIRESWQPVEASCREFRKISVLKISANRKT